MGLFSFKQKKSAANTNPESTIDAASEIAGGSQSSVNPAVMEQQSYGIDAIYAFLQADYEARGYNDALTNPDESYKADNIKLFQHDLQILIQRSFIFYDDKLKEIDFHIGSRSRAGLVDLVEELKIKRMLVVEHIEKVRMVQQETANNGGLSDRVRLSYQRGFTRGLSAITQSKVMNINL